MLFIIRHGQTQLNNAKALQGRSDHPLNETGIQQARTAALTLGKVSFAHVFSSPLQRAIQTAKILVPDTEPVIDERLIEMEYGPYEGLDLAHMPQEILTFFSDFVHNPAPEGMEQLSSVVERTGSFLADIKGLKGNVLISTHAIAMKGLLENLTPGSNGSYWGKYIGNCEIYTVQKEDGHFLLPEVFREAP